jgi:polyisoprenoid-binding protein YceI
MRSFRVSFAALAFGIGAVCLLIPGDAAAKLAGSSGTAVFHAKATPGDLSIDGTTSDVAVADDGTNVTVTVQLGNISTGMSLRDRHTKKALEVGSFSNASLSVPRASLNFAGGTADAKGALTIHGQTKQVSFHYTATKSGNSFAVKGTTHILLTDYGIQVPSYVGVTVKNDVDLEVSFTAVDG